jgi:hypothetical protein
MNTTSTVKLNIHQPPKPKGWCDENGIAHSWEAGPTLTCNPPIPTRECLNCGKRQFFAPGHWEDA